MTGAAFTSFSDAFHASWHACGSSAVVTALQVSMCDVTRHMLCQHDSPLTGSHRMLGHGSLECLVCTMMMAGATA